MFARDVHFRFIVGSVVQQSAALARTTATRINKGSANAAKPLMSLLESGPVGRFVQQS